MGVAAGVAGTGKGSAANSVQQSGSSAPRLR